jgi:aspartate racemase
MAIIESFPLTDEIVRAKTLLNENENEVPANVLTIIRFCCEHRIGFILSRNIKVMSCKDARSNRVRLGHTGIPLFDELKSIVFVGVDNQGERIIIAAHCRGHMSIDKKRLAEMFLLRDEPEIMPEEELNEKLGMVFGTVSPMLIDANSNAAVPHVFDEEVTKAYAKCPGTMMTNAGNHTWGIELDPVELINAVTNSRICKIAVPDKELGGFEVPERINPKSIGIITGNGPDSGIALWNSINKYFLEARGRHFLGDISLPKVTVISLPAMGLSMELDKRDSATWETITEAIKKLQHSNVELLALACHTTHYYTGRIRDLFEHEGAKFVSMAETTIDFIKREQLSDIAVVGINFVADLQKYSAYSELSQLNVEDVPSDILAEFHLLGYEVKKMTNYQRTYQRFTSLLKKIQAKNVVLALTELSILYEKQRKPSSVKNVIDPLDIYAHEIVRQSLCLPTHKGGAVL